MRACPALRPRRDLGARPTGRFGVAFRRLENLGSHGAVMSGLNDTACPLAVYASPRRLPDATQNSLPVGGQPFPGGSDYPLGSMRSFTPESLPAIPSEQAFLAHQHLTPDSVDPRFGKAKVPCDK